MKADALLNKLRRGEPLSLAEQILMPFLLSLPAMLAQISTIIMEYIDASMVGGLGAEASASIGIVASSTWLFGGICSAASAGFTVQIAQLIGAGREKDARSALKQALIVTLTLSVVMSAAGVFISRFLPVWLGGDESISGTASSYFMIFALAIPFIQLNSLASGALQCSGNMRIPGILHIVMCLLDVVFNTLLIFPTGRRSIFGLTFSLPGAGLGVAGAALGTSLAEAVIAVVMLCFALFRSPSLRLRRGERFTFSASCLKKAVRIAVPIGIEQAILSGAQVMVTRIVSPLGNISIAANSFSVTAEGICYMPGYGISTAATTLIGQSIGAGRRPLARRLAWVSTLMGMVMMTVTGAMMYFFAPYMIGILSPDPAIRELGALVLRIEAFAEPMFAASIVASGALRGAGDTFIPSCMNLLSMWAVRLPIAAYFAPRLGLRGVWIAMCVELCVRGTIFLIRLGSKGWSTEKRRFAAAKT